MSNNRQVHNITRIWMANLKAKYFVHNYNKHMHATKLKKNKLILILHHYIMSYSVAARENLQIVSDVYISVCAAQFRVRSV